ncbi:MAG: hypothetical protein ACYC5A_05845 [Thermoleophilia bacterium]
MTKKKKKKPDKPRNPFAGHPRSGAGFHDEKKYGKKDRREGKEELEERESEDAGD